MRTNKQFLPLRLQGHEPRKLIEQQERRPTEDLACLAAVQSGR
jgi:hypothetical protein